MLAAGERRMVGACNKVKPTMQRRKFLIASGALAAGGAAALGSGAFSRVESQRAVTIQVANDANAYLGFLPKETPNSDNYFDYDNQGHAYINIADQAEGGGEGINSNSRTWFDGLFELCNQGKAPVTRVELDASGLTVNDSNNALDVWVYTSYDSSDVPPSETEPPNHWNRRFKIVEDGQGQNAILDETSVAESQNVEATDGGDFPRGQALGIGNCTSVGMLFDTRGDPPVDASGGVRTLIDGELTVTAVAPDAG